MQEPTYHDHGVPPLGRHAALLPAVIADRLTAETGIDPAAEPALPDLPVWPDYRPVSQREMDTGELPAVPPQWEPADHAPSPAADGLEPHTVQLDPVPAGDDPAEVPA